MKSIKVNYWIPLAGVALLALAGCSNDPGEIVKQRAAERWELLINRQAVKAYEYLSPGYRATHTLDQYVASIAMAPLKWKSARVVDKQCDAEVCTVKLFVTAVIPGQLAHVPRDIEHDSPVTERWVHSEGRWYFLPEAHIDSKATDATPISGSPQPEPSQPATPQEGVGNK